MLCEKCGKYSATTHIHTVVNGVVSEKNLCDYCAASEGLNQNPFESMLASMFGESLEIKPKNIKKCPVCGTLFSEISKNGKVGCPQCYKEFKEELLPYLKRMHGSTKHIGKLPNSKNGTTAQNSNQNSTQNSEINKLRDELKRLIAEENYEQAAVIRDKIKKIEGGSDE